MAKNNKNAISDENLENVSGGYATGYIPLRGSNIGMANPYDTPEKKQAYQDYKNGDISMADFAKIMGQDMNK